MLLLTIDSNFSYILKLVSGNELDNTGVSFFLHFCHLLESLYDPYFTWRNFLRQMQVDFGTFALQPALLHVEVIPFVYGKSFYCLQVKFIGMFSLRQTLSCCVIRLLWDSIGWDFSWAWHRITSCLRFCNFWSKSKLLLFYDKFKSANYEVAYKSKC